MCIIITRPDASDDTFVVYLLLWRRSGIVPSEAIYHALLTTTDHKDLIN